MTIIWEMPLRCESESVNGKTLDGEKSLSIGKVSDWLSEFFVVWTMRKLSRLYSTFFFANFFLGIVNKSTGYKNPSMWWLTVS